MFQVCIGSMGQTDCLKPIQITMKGNSKLVVLGCETMARLFLANKDTLVKQVTYTDNLPYADMLQVLMFKKFNRYVTLK